MYDKLLFFKDGSNNIPHPHVLQHDPVALTLMQSLLLHPFQSRWTYGSSERTQSDPPPGTALNHPSRFYSLKTLTLGKYFSCKPSYMTRWLLWDDCGEALEDNRPVWGQGAEAPEMQAKEPSQKWILQVQPVPHGKKQWPRWVIPKLLTCTVTSKIKWLLKDSKFWGSLLCN